MSRKIEVAVEPVKERSAWVAFRHAVREVPSRWGTHLIRSAYSTVALLLVFSGVADPAWAQHGATRPAVRPLPTLPILVEPPLGIDRPFLPDARSLADSIASERTREAAARARGSRLVISLAERRLWWMKASDTVYSAPVAIGKGVRLEARGASWDFSTPRGVRRVIGKEENPVWIPPDWHYVELAQDSAFGLVRLERGRDVRLSDGSRVVVRGERIGRVFPDGRYEEVPPDEEIIFGRTLFIPPLGTANRRIEGELGAYKLDLGGGYLLHGTPHKDSIGSAATHGCIRLHDEDVEYLYRSIPVGTPVFIY